MSTPTFEKSSAAVSGSWWIPGSSSPAGFGKFVSSELSVFSFRKVLRVRLVPETSKLVNSDLLGGTGSVSELVVSKCVWIMKLDFIFGCGSGGEDFSGVKVWSNPSLLSSFIPVSGSKSRNFKLNLKLPILLSKLSYTRIVVFLLKLE